MQRQVLGVLAAVAVLGPAVAQAAPARTADLRLSGVGGQQAELAVGRGGLTIEYPLDGAPRLPGPDAAIGGFAIQRASDGELAGGVLLENAPGFPDALALPLVESERTTLPAGRYRLTLLGTGPQQVRVRLVGATRSRHLAARGPARPVTRTTAGTASTLASWSELLGRIGPDDQVVVGAGGAGDLQQAETAQLCLRPADSGGPCLPEGNISAFPGAGGSAAWDGYLYGQGSLPPGSYEFSGHVAGVGPSSRVAYLAVVISLRR